MIQATCSTRWLLVALTLATANCGGGQFMSADSDGSGGGEGPGDNGKITPGVTAGSGAVQVDPGGTGGTTQTIEPGDVPLPDENGGEPGVIGSGEAGAGSDPVAGPETLDLIECGPNAFGTGIVPTLYSTLDSAVAITEPQIGELGFVGNAEGDYHGDHCGGLSINIDQTGDYIKYHYQDNDVRHYSPLTGALDFWYRPSYAHTDDLNHRLFSTANFATLGGFRMRKAALDNGNAFQVTVASSTLATMEINVPADQYSFSPGQWLRVTLIWYLASDQERRYVRLFLDGALAGEVEPSADFFMESDEGGFFVFGAWDFGDAQHAAGLLDELKVFARGP